MLVWLGHGVLKLGKETINTGEEFDETKVENKTLEKLIKQKKIGEAEKVKVKKVKKPEKESK